MVGWGCFSPVTSRVSPRQPSYFFLLRQKKVTKKKASHVRAASRSLALLAAFGALANSLRSNNASALIRTLLRCSARPNGGGIPHGSSASRTSPERLVRFANFAREACSLRSPRGVGLPHSSRITSHKGTARRATTTDPSFLIPPRHSGSKRRTQTSSFRAQSRNPCFPALQLGCCDYAQHDGMCRAPLPPSPTPFPVFPHSSLLTPHSSLLIPLSAGVGIFVWLESAASGRCFHRCSQAGDSPINPSVFEIFSPETSMKDTRFISSLGACILALSLTLAACGGGGSSDTGSSGGGGSNTGGGGSTVVEKPAITTQPASQSVVTNSTATFMVTATGGAPLAYQWKKNGTDISGANASTYTTPATSMGDNAAVFTVAVSNTAGTATSTEARLTVTATAEAPTVTTQPAGQTVITGASASFSVSATGTSPLTYQWKKDGIAIPGATSSTYTIAATSLTDSAVFAVVVSNGAGTATSNNATLTVADALVAPAITKQPAAQSVTAGQTAKFTVEATGTAPLRYQWKLNDQDISGATDSSYATSDTNTVGNDAVFTVVVSNGTGTATSDKATLTVTPAPVAPAITTQPMSQAVATGQTASFSVAATGTEPLAYQWKKNGSDIAGATSSTYKPVSSSELNGAKFSVVVTNSVGTVTSNEAVLSDVAISVQPAAQPVLAPATASFSVTAAGTGTLTYQWKKNGTNIAGATSSTYTTPATSHWGRRCAVYGSGQQWRRPSSHQQQCKAIGLCRKIQRGSQNRRHICPHRMRQRQHHRSCLGGEKFQPW